MILDQNRGPARSSGNIDRSRRHHHCPARLYAIYAREFQPVRNAFLGQAPSITSLSKFETKVPGLGCRSNSTILSKCTTTAEFHDASSAGSTQKFFLLRSVSNVRKLWASMTSVT